MAEVIEFPLRLRGTEFPSILRVAEGVFTTGQEIRATAGAGRATYIALGAEDPRASTGVLTLALKSVDAEDDDAASR